VLAAGAAWVAILSRAVATGSLETYPVLFPDSFDWLANALRYTGVPLDVTWRAVLTPFLQAALFAMHDEALIPLLGPCWLVATILVLVTLGRRLVGDAALYAAVLFAANHHVLAHGLVIGSDTLMVALNTTGLLSTALAVERQEARWLLLAAPAFALGWLAQPLAPLLAPTVALMLLARGPGPARALAARPAAAGALALAGLILAGAEGVRFGLTGLINPISKIVRPVAFPAPYLSHYLWASLAAWSWPVLALAVGGAIVALRDGRCRRLGAAAIVLIATHLLFFGLVYDWPDSRFVLYWTVPALLLAGTALTRLRPAARWPLMAAAVLWTNLNVATITGDHGLGGSQDLAAVCWPGHAVVLDRASGTLRPAATAPYPFRDGLRRWARARRRASTLAGSDDIYFSLDRLRATRIAAALAPAGTPLWFELLPGLPRPHVYILRNQLPLYARRPVEMLDAATGPPPGASGVLIAPVAVADRLLAEQRGGSPPTLIHRGPRYAVLRVAP
jgi:hypothetical protein